MADSSTSATPIQTQEDPVEELRKVEIGLWTVLKPYLWKIVVGIAFSLLGTLSYFQLRNSQNGAKIDSLTPQVQSLTKQFWEKQAEEREWNIAQDKKLVEYETRLKTLEELEKRWYQETKDARQK